MSRIGKKPIPLPSGVKVQIGEQLQVTGPKGSLTVPIPPGIRIEQKDGKLELLRDSDQHAALHGLTRALAANAVQGVSAGFTRELDIVGIGYRAEIKGKIATFTPATPVASVAVPHTPTGAQPPPQIDAR